MSARVTLLALAVFAAACPARAQQKVATCVRVEAARDRAGLATLVASEVDRHPSHHAVDSNCSTHLKVEVADVAGVKFVTARVDGEVPYRVRAEPGPKGLEQAIVGALTVVLGTDPVALRAPGGQSWFSEKALRLRDHGRSTLDLAVLESISLVAGRADFAPAILAGFSREITDWQVGVEAMLTQALQRRDDRAGLDTQLRLQLTVTHFLSATADTAAFVGASAGVAHQRFSGPIPLDLGGGEGTYNVTGPCVAARTGVEFFRTTTMRAVVLADLYLPIFVANDRQNEIVHGWVPGASLGAGARF